MTITPASFRVAYPEFVDISQYPDVQLTLWISRLPLMMNVGRWDSLADIGGELLIAHIITSQARDVKTAAVGGAPGQTSGPIASKGVGPASVSFDVGAATLPGAGDFNTTKYGVRYYGLLNQIGMGGLQMGGWAGTTTPGIWDAGPIWPW